MKNVTEQFRMIFHGLGWTMFHQQPWIKPGHRQIQMSQFFLTWLFTTTISVTFCRWPCVPIAYMCLVAMAMVQKALASNTDHGLSVYNVAGHRNAMEGIRWDRENVIKKLILCNLPDTVLIKLCLFSLSGKTTCNERLHNSVVAWLQFYCSYS